MTVNNKNRFPYLYQLDKLGHQNHMDRSVEIGKYLEEYNRELNDEYEIILSASVERFKYGNNRTIHLIYED